MSETSDQDAKKEPVAEVPAASEKLAEKFDLTPLLDVLKSVGIVIGSLSSVAVLFFWIGNAIIVARLRAYNLYGVVRYTDEYITEAGYQFIQDIFTFFQDWKVVLLFVAVIACISITIPVGPFTPANKNEQVATGKLGVITNAFNAIRRLGLHYILFIALAISASLILITNLPVKKLYSNIFDQEQRLTLLVAKAKTKPLVFLPRQGADNSANTFQKIFYNELTASEKPTREWLNATLSELSGGGDEDLREKIRKFQEELDIHESPDFKFDGDFDKSATYRTLLNIRLNNKLSIELPRRIANTLADINMLLGSGLTSEEDENFSTLVTYTANNRPANDSIHELKVFRDNVSVFFEAGDDNTKNVLDEIDELHPFRFGQIFLSYSFWVLIGIFIYLIINSMKIVKFRQWELGYFASILLIFLTIVVTLPTSYGRYKYEFKVLKLNDIVFSGDEKGESPVSRKLAELKSKDASLYILGPTKGKEVILGAIKASRDSSTTAPQIIMMDRETVKYMNVEPLRCRDIPEIIALLRQSR